MAETRSSVFTSVRSESARGCSPRCSRTVRKPSVIAASATSLAVTPNLRHTLSTAARELAPCCSAAWWLTGPARRVQRRGPAPRAAAVLLTTLLAEARHRASAQLALSACDDETCLRANVLAKVSLSASSQSLVSRWAAEVPSARQWWIFIKIAHWLPLRPSMIQHSHSGRSRSRGRSRAWAMARNNSASSPGRGNRHPAHMVGEVEFRIVDPLLVPSKACVRSTWVHRGIDRIRSARNVFSCS